MEDIIYITPAIIRLGFWQRLFGVSEQVTSETDELLQRAGHHTEAKDWPETMNVLTFALSQEPCSPYIHCLIGDCYRSAGYDDLAKQFYDETIRLSGRWRYNTNVESAMHSLACILQKEGQIDAAVFLFNKILRKTTNSLRKKNVRARLRAIAKGS